jgi:NADPH:quinone reductase-like Zn-dependent oxidoreductase
MKAIVYHQYGSPHVLELREIERPTVTEDDVLVRVRAASVNPFDWHYLTGEPYLVRLSGGLRKPKRQTIGADFAGTVEAVGSNVADFQSGDEVFGVRNGAFGEYVSVRQDRAVVRKPPNVSFEHAAAVPIAGVTALQALRDKGKVQSGQTVLINGASGGVGTFAVQIAKSFGAEVTGVCSTRNVEMVRSLGADHVIDYTREDFTLGRKGYDVMLDIAGNRSWSELKRVLAEEATLVWVGGPKTNRWIGPLGQAVKLRLTTLAGSRTVAAPFLAKVNKDDLAVLAELLESGKVTPVIEREYELTEVPDALRYLGEGHARGKLLVSV